MDVNPTGQGNRIFVSYAHLDDELLNQAVEHFTKDLQSFYAAKTGGTLDIFFDRESIGWGTDWRRRIDSELRGASIFMPIITMQYFNRPACREELNAFHGSAELLGAGYLILPVVILGASGITADSQMPEVRLIESLQFENLEEAFLAGRGTREWREALSRITDKLVSVISRAEENLANVESSELTLEAVSGDDDFDLFQHFDELNQIGERLASEMEDSTRDLTNWCTVVQDEMQKFGATSPAVLRAQSVVMARAVQEPSLKLQSSATALAQSVTGADALLRSMVGQLVGVNTSHGAELAEKIIADITQGSSSLQPFVDGLAEILEMLKTMEIMSVPLRKAIKPGRVGFTKWQDAMKTIEGWQGLSVR
ncbi:TIR domain-containing protein [Streptomyces lincolnensis]|uniref:TIR domain-containing protein n=1 Tax=Streptomyces lincolnensis TaxID=1915 RepID=UPI0009A133BF|nr:TIR domain-containing protein [Streptomyces lincolnensis]QMV08482.1 TIR domain-containing protein [Streptomyces lincolnensis]